MSENKTNINWFPGHMTKASRQMSEVLKSCDMVIELRDSRAPFSCENPLLEQIINNKPRLVILTKKDIADSNCVNNCMNQLKQLGNVIAIDSLHNFNRDYIVEQCYLLMKEKHAKQRAKGIKPRAVRAMVCGIPNVGKSTFINQMKKKKQLVTQNRPGVTQSITWIKVNDKLDLADTPGLLWPKFTDQKVAIHLALINAIKQQNLDNRDIAMEAMRLMLLYYPDNLKQRYKNFDSTKPFESIAESMNTTLELSYTLFLNDLNNARLGAISYEGHM